MDETLAALRAAYPPPRTHITPSECAAALHKVGPGGRVSPGRVNRVRERLEQGTLIPGLRKDGGRWRVPIAAFALALDRVQGPAPDLAPVKGSGVPVRLRQRVPIGPRMGLQHARAREVWGAVLEALLAELNRSQLDALGAAVSLPQGAPEGRDRP